MEDEIIFEGDFLDLNTEYKYPEIRNIRFWDKALTEEEIKEESL